MKQTQLGFTLIELMIVVAIVGILAGIAYPSYQDSVMKSRRADAEGALLGFANAMERYFTVNNTYVGAPVVAGTDYYNLAISEDPAPTASTYTLTATPRATDKCGTLTLTQAGVKGFNGTGVTAADCW